VPQQGITRSEDKEIMRAMSSVVVARVVGSTAAVGGDVFRGAKPASGRAFPLRKKALVVAVALLALLAAFAALIAGPREDCLHPSESDDQ